MIIIDYKDTRPIYEQIVERFKTLILKDVLEPDQQMPSVRNLAMELSINPNTIQKAYAELERQGYIYSVKGRGSFVAARDTLLLEKQQEYRDKIVQLAKEAMEYGVLKNDMIKDLENIPVKGE